MEGLGQAFSSFFSNPQALNALKGGTAVAGEAGNILEGIKRLQYQNFVMNLLKNPQQLAAMAAKIQQPLNAGLTQSVNNQVQGDMAARGLSQAPGIFAATQSQALAPYYQQNQNAALNAVMQSLGLPAGTFGGGTQNPFSIFGNLKMPTPTPTSQTPTPGLTAPTVGDPTSTPIFGDDSGYNG